MDNDVTAPSLARNPAGILLQGTVVAGRFTIEALTGRGGMGSVYRASDALTGQPVAVKFLHAAISPEVAYRFNREAVLLAGLSHPGIVSYVAHGSAEAGQPFLVMEWLEGEDLARRLTRQRLGLAETLALLRRAAEALAVAHQKGIVHRDLKPSNLLLRGGRPEDVVLLDFGLARHAMRTLVGVTGSDTVVGTPGYMAPEQASSQSEILPTADIFSLGCVLYECLTGQPPFAAPHFAAVLAKILFAEPAPLCTLCPGLPPGVQLLVDRMLAKEPRRRLPDAASLLEALSVLESGPVLPPRAMEDTCGPSLAGAEQQLVSVLLVSLKARVESGPDLGESGALKLRDLLREALAPHGAQVELLADGSLVATLVPERGTATDLAALAARCALTFKERWPEAAVVLVTGLGVFRSERLPVGEAMDRAGQLLHQLERGPASSSVVMDEVTAGLLGPGFQLSRSHSGTFLLQGEQLDADASRPLLGKPTPCVGREQELALLDFTLDACLQEPAARALLVTAPAGVGKSRLRHEFLRRIEREARRVLVLLGRGDPMGSGASYGLMGQALRRLCGIVEGENLEARRTRLYQRVARHLPEEEAQDVAGFLGELCAIPFPEELSPRLRVARGDPRLMSAQVSRALVSFLGAECAHQPVLLVLEDLHWGDALTVKLVDEALRELAEQPFMVLALARPEVKALFPGLWSRRLQELAMHGLSRKASIQLIQEVLGSQVPTAIVQRTVEQCAGNALFLEELIRMVAEGRGEAPPETVLAVLQARLMRMEPGPRQVLLAASVFGRTFWSGGVRELLGRQYEGDVLEKYLRQLVEQEVIEPLPVGRFSSEEEYRFRHALVRDAAHGLVPEGHRSVAHRLAGVWLERMGESDTRVLATHYQLGQQPERAVHFHTLAAEQLFERGDLQGMVRCVEAALACGVRGEALTRLRALQSVVAFWMEQIPKTMEFGDSSLAGLKAGSRLWCNLLGCLIVGISRVNGSQERLNLLSELLLSTMPEPDAIAAYFEAGAYLVVTVISGGERQKSEIIRERLVEMGAGLMTHDALARAWLDCLRAYGSHFLEARPWRAFLLAEKSMRGFREIGLERGASMMQALFGMTQAALGDVSGALAPLRESLADARRTEQQQVVTNAQHYLLQVLAGSCEPAHRQEALELARDWLADESYNLKPGLAHATSAQVLAASGELGEAEAHARKACELLESRKSYQLFALTILSTVLRAQGRGVEARRVATLGVGEMERMDCKGIYAVSLYLALAEACFAEGDASAGDATLRKALQCVTDRASDIPDPAIRERFLLQVPENARTLELSRQRWDESAA
jgi:eukaryotic-like serine/threonine-protein kinase